MTTTIRNCPFCDHDDVEINEIEPGRYAIDCPECECIGPFADDVDTAIRLWNSPLRAADKLRLSVMTERVQELERQIELAPTIDPDKEKEAKRILEAAGIEPSNASVSRPREAASETSPPAPRSA